MILYGYINIQIYIGSARKYPIIMAELGEREARGEM